VIAVAHRPGKGSSRFRAPRWDPRRSTTGTRVAAWVGGRVPGGVRQGPDGPGYTESDADTGGDRVRRPVGCRGELGRQVGLGQ
jgi:hypothetical protein